MSTINTVTIERILYKLKFTGVDNIKSKEDLKVVLEQITSALSTTKSDWLVRETALRCLSDVCSEIHCNDEAKNNLESWMTHFCTHKESMIWKDLGLELGDQMGENRSQITHDTSRVIIALSNCLKQRFVKIAGIVLQPTLQVCGSSVEVIAHHASDALRHIFANVVSFKLIQGLHKCLMNNENSKYKNNEIPLVIIDLIRINMTHSSRIKTKLHTLIQNHYDMLTKIIEDMLTICLTQGRTEQIRHNAAYAIIDYIELIPQREKPLMSTLDTRSIKLIQRLRQSEDSELNENDRKLKYEQLSTVKWDLFFERNLQSSAQASPKSVSSDGFESDKEDQIFEIVNDYGSPGPSPSRRLHLSDEIIANHRIVETKKRDSKEEEVSGCDDRGSLGEIMGQLKRVQKMNEECQSTVKTLQSQYSDEGWNDVIDQISKQMETLQMINDLMREKKS